MVRQGLVRNSAFFPPRPPDTGTHCRTIAHTPPYGWRIQTGSTHAIDHPFDPVLVEREPAILDPNMVRRSGRRLQAPIPDLMDRLRPKPVLFWEPGRLNRTAPRFGRLPKVSRRLLVGKPLFVHPASVDTLPLLACRIHVCPGVFNIIRRCGRPIQSTMIKAHNPVVWQ